MGSQLLLLLQHQLQLLLLQLLSKLLRTGQLRLKQVTGQLHQQLQLNKHQLPTLGEVLANGDKHGVICTLHISQKPNVKPNAKC